MEFRKICNFKFNDNTYLLLLSNKNKRYFLKQYNDTYVYPELLELIKLNYLFASFPNIKKVAKDKINIIPKAFFKGTLITITLSTVLTSCSLLNYDNLLEYYKKRDSKNPSIESTIQNSLAFDVIDGNEEVELETYFSSEYSDNVYIYDLDFLDMCLDYKTISINDIKNAIFANNNINNTFKDLLYEFVNMLSNKYPDYDLRVLYENIKRLEIVECSKEELMLKSISVDSYGCYIISEDKIYVLEGYEFKKGTWDYQVIMHEFSHMLRNMWIDKGNKHYQISEGLNTSFTTLSEALNSIFTVSLFDYEEKDIAYQLQSNIYKTIIESLDNYNIADFHMHSESYFAKVLDEQTGYTNYATIIFELIDTQYKDYHSDYIEIDPEEYYPIYDYIADLYFKKYINKDMSYNDAKNIVDKLIAQLTFDVPSEYNIDTNHFYEYFDIYYENLNHTKQSNLK